MSKSATNTVSIHVEEHLPHLVSSGVLTLAKSLKDAIADPWLTLVTKQGVVCANLCTLFVGVGGGT